MDIKRTMQSTKKLNNEVNKKWQRSIISDNFLTENNSPEEKMCRGTIRAQPSLRLLKTGHCIQILTRKNYWLTCFISFRATLWILLSFRSICDMFHQFSIFFSTSSESMAFIDRSNVLKLLTEDNNAPKTREAKVGIKIRSFHILCLVCVVTSRTKGPAPCHAGATLLVWETPEKYWPKLSSNSFLKP